MKSSIFEGRGRDLKWDRVADVCRRLIIGGLLPWASTAWGEPALPAREMTLASEGISSWTTRPAAVRHGGRLYFAYQNQRRVEVNFLDAATGKAATPFVLHTYTYDDDHGTPSLFVVPSGQHAGKLVVIFSHHNAALYSRRCRTAGDLRQWDDAVTVDGGGCNYPKPLIRSDGSVWMSYRLSGTGHVYRTTPDGSTWSPATTLASAQDGLLYVFIAARGDSFHMAFGRYEGTSKRFRDAYHAISGDGGITWGRSDGSPIALPITAEKATCIYDDTSQEWSRVLDVAVHDDGTPAILFYYDMPNFRSGSMRFLEMKVAQARWNGSDWRMEDIPASAPYHRANLKGRAVYACSGAQRPGDINTVVLMEGSHGEYSGAGFETINTPCRAHAVLYRRSHESWRRIGRITDAPERWEHTGRPEAFETRAQWVHGRGEVPELILSRVTHYRAYEEWASALILVRCSK